MKTMVGTEAYKVKKHVIDLHGVKRDIKKNYQLFLLSLPAVILVFIFSYMPLPGILIAFKDFKFDLGIAGSKWIGFKNFEYLFAQSGAWKITFNTLSMNLLFIFLTLIISIVFALMLYEMSRKSVKLYQTIMFLPFFISWVVAAYVFLAMLDMEHGFINGILKSLGLQEVLWYNEPKFWPAILTLVYIWKFAGYYSIIYYTALLGIETEYYEAATIDGATKLQQVRKISIPLIMPIITIMVLLQLGKVFYADFGLFYYVTRDSSALYPVTDVIDTYVYRALRSLGDFGMSAAACLYQSAVGFVFIMVSNYVVKKINPENSLF